jgi:surface antigen
MKKILIIIAAALSLSACTTTQEGVGAGAVAGAVVGAATTGTVAGAAVGAVVGGAAGGVIGHVAGRDGYCYYEPDHHHRARYVERCPSGY